MLNLHFFILGRVSQHKTSIPAAAARGDPFKPRES